MLVRSILVLCILSGVGTAGVRAQTEGGFVVRDSVGVEVVENADSAWTSSTAWSIADSPSLQIGSRNGANGPAFGRISHAARLSDGRFAVADPMARQVMFLNEWGRFSALAGRIGDGPAEVRHMGRLWVIQGDTVVVEDPESGKLVYFGPTGEHSRTVMGPGRGWKGHLGVETVAVCPDGSFFVTSFPQPSEYSRGRGVTRAPLWVFDKDGSELGLVDSLPAFETVNEGNTQDNVALGPRRQFAVDSSGVWYGYPQTFELRHETAQGVDRIIRRPWKREAVSRAVRQRWMEWRRNAFSGPLPPSIEGILEREPISDSLPAFDRIVASSDGHVWVEEPMAPEELTPENLDRGFPLTPRPWSVFDPNGRWLGTVVMPEGLQVTEIGPDYVLGIWQDELDVPFVRIYEIIKPTHS